MPKQGGKFVLSSAEEAQLQQLIRAHGTPQGLAQRVRVVQLASQGMGVRTIGERVGMRRTGDAHDGSYQHAKRQLYLSHDVSWLLSAVDETRKFFCLGIAEEVFRFGRSAIARI